MDNIDAVCRFSPVQKFYLSKPKTYILTTDFPQFWESTYEITYEKNDDRELLVYLSALFVYFLLHTRECDRSSWVGMETVWCNLI